MLRFAAGLLSIVGCAATEDTSQFGDDDGKDSSSSEATTLGSGGGPSLDGGTGSGAGAPSDCTEESKLVYVVGQGNELYSFYPPDLSFKSVGVINCNTGGFSQPFSMAVARNGTAYVLFTDGKLYAVDTTTAACQPTSFTPGQAGLMTFGMGYVSDTANSDAETLYVADYAGSGIAKIDTTSMTLSFLGQYDAIDTSAELTGTGDARLYGFFLATPVIVAEIDKTSGHIITQAPQNTVTIGTAWAFAFWGGDFYLFTNPSGLTSQVDRYRPADGTTVTVKQNVGLSIVGAGVSTCAPVEPPK